MTTKDAGGKSEGAVMAALLKLGKKVLLPVGENQPYDLVVDDDGERFIRIQCKTAHRVRNCNDVIMFNACSIHAHRGRGRVDYRGKIDVFGVYFPEQDRVFIVPVDTAPKVACSLRLSLAKNNQRKGIRMADDFELG